MQLGSLSSFIADAQAAAAKFVNRTEGYVINALSSFRDKRGQLNFNIAKLKKNAPLTNAPELVKAEYRIALAEAEDAKQKADWVGRIADEFTNITGLGVLPALIAGVPIAVMLAAVAGAVYLIANVNGHVSRYLNAKAIAEAANAQGKDGAAAAASYLKSAGTGGGLFGDASQLVWPIALAGVAYLLIADKRGRR